MSWRSMIERLTGSRSTAAAHSPLFLALLEEAEETAESELFKPGETPVGRQILESPPERQIEVLCEGWWLLCNGMQLPTIGPPDWRHYEAVRRIVGQLLQRSLPLEESDLVGMLRGSTRIKGVLWNIPLSALVGVVERHLNGRAATGELYEALKPARDRIYASRAPAELKKLGARIDRLLDHGDDGAKKTPFKVVDAWTACLAKWLESESDQGKAAWLAVLEWCDKGGGGTRPTGKFRKGCEPLIVAVGANRFRDVMVHVLDAVGTAHDAAVGAFEAPYAAGHPTLVYDEYSDRLRALIWCASLVGGDELIVALGGAAERCYKKVPHVGPRAPKIGNACVGALSRMNSAAAVAQISRLKTRVKHASVRGQIDKALREAAESAGLTMADLEELAVPTFGLTGVGVVEQPMGEHRATLRVLGPVATELSWTGADGKTQKSPPKQLREEHADAIKAIKGTDKQIRDMLPAQRDRIERLLLNPRSWTYGVWRHRYLDHVLIGTMGRRLIWRLGDSGGTAGIWWEGRMVDAKGAPIEVKDGASVSLWHPIDSSTDHVQQWRAWLMDHEVTQPFKQAHREVYLLTDAERQTSTYSNRFAAHVLKQHQFTALCQTRGWRYHVQGGWDSHNVPTIELPEHGMKVEFWVEPLAGNNQEVSATGAFLHVATDQVRFYRTGETTPMPLADAPPRVFSELMRDVDLFVGVASVGNDPNWMDSGEERHRDYWNTYSFGDLSATAQTRKAVLTRLLPRLKIASRCRLDEKFLVVRGDRRTYKVHLGSSNILMEPNDQYLCIVPNAAVERGAADKVFLPFEGDRTLAIILSKAFLLADDAKITDQTILSQINR